MTASQNGFCEAVNQEELTVAEVEAVEQRDQLEQLVEVLPSLPVVEAKGWSAPVVGQVLPLEGRESRPTVRA